jgi:predicted secreted protein
MASSAVSTFGITLEMETTEGSGSYVTIAELVECQTLNLTRDQIEVTNHDTSDNFKEMIKALCDQGELNFKANWIVANSGQNSSTGLLSDFLDDDKRRWKITLEPGVYITTYGFLTKASSDGPVSAARQISGSLRAVGLPTFTGC